MTPEDIIRLAREAGFLTDSREIWIHDYEGICTEEIERFAALVAALAQPEQEQATVKDSLQVDLEEEPRVTQRIADMPMSEYRRGVNDGFKLGLREGRIKAEDEMMVGPIEPTRRMIEAGAQRLVSWEDGSVWPDSWDALQLAAARNDAERVWRSMRAEAPKQGPRREPPPEPIHPDKIRAEFRDMDRCCLPGEMTVEDWFTEGVRFAEKHHEIV
jgi:hypothetical protein